MGVAIANFIADVISFVIGIGLLGTFIWLFYIWITNFFIAENEREDCFWFWQLFGYPSILVTGVGGWTFALLYFI